jgi:6-phosphogluconolactonase
MNITVFNDLEKLYKKAADTFIDLSKNLLKNIIVLL